MDIKPTYEELEHQIKILEAWKAMHEDTSDQKVFIESEEPLQDLVNVSFDGIIIHDNGKIIFTNENTVDYLGYTFKELTKMSILDLDFPEGNGLEILPAAFGMPFFPGSCNPYRHGG